MEFGRSKLKFDLPCISTTENPDPFYELPCLNELGQELLKSNKLYYLYIQAY